MNNGRTLHNAEALSSKFDKLINVQKHTGELYCPLVKTAKIFAKDILSHVNVVNIRVMSMDGTDTINMTPVGDTNEDKIDVKEENEVFGQRPNKRFAGPRGV